MKKIFSQYLDLPKLELKWPKGDPNNSQHKVIPTPDHLIKQLDGSYLGCTEYLRYPASQEYVDWFLSIIPELKGKVGDIGWQIHNNYHSLPQGIQMPVHTDGRRGPFVISFMIEKGGPNPITKWYQEHGEPIERVPLVGQVKGVPPVPYERLTELESIEIELDKWILFRSDILHDVKPIFTRRECFTVGFFDKDLYFYIAEKYGVKE